MGFNITGEHAVQSKSGLYNKEILLLHNNYMVIKKYI
jgi:hypothetical protein